MRHLLRAIIPAALLAGIIVGGVKLIATGTTHGLFHGGWSAALDAVGWALILVLTFASYRYERHRRFSASGALRNHEPRREGPRDADVWQDYRS